MSPDANASAGAKRKYDAILEETLDTRTIDIEDVRRRLQHYLEAHRVSYADVIIQIICDYLTKERFPDAKVMQCDLNDYGFLSTRHLRRLMATLWQELLRPSSTSLFSSSASAPSTTTSSSSTSSSSSSSSSDYYKRSRRESHSERVSSSSASYHHLQRDIYGRAYNCPP